MMGRAQQTYAQTGGGLAADEMIVDLFAGGGGASTAIYMATGRHPDVAVNHDPNAVALHAANHPDTKHYCCDVFEVDPLEACADANGNPRPVGLLWASPDCTHHSKARGGKPADKKIRALAWVVVKWASKVKPRCIFLENVEEFQDWGPLGDDDRPIKARKGETFRLWVSQLEALGYQVDWRELVAADFGAPTTRKRLFLIARRDGRAIRGPSRPTRRATRPRPPTCLPRRWSPGGRPRRSLTGRSTARQSSTARSRWRPRRRSASRGVSRSSSSGPRVRSSCRSPMLASARTTTSTNRPRRSHLPTVANSGW